jgi:hypothetical protein
MPLGLLNDASPLVGAAGAEGAGRGVLRKN